MYCSMRNIEPAHFCQSTSEQLQNLSSVVVHRGDFTCINNNHVLLVRPLPRNSAVIFLAPRGPEYKSTGPETSADTEHDKCDRT